MASGLDSNDFGLASSVDQLSLDDDRSDILITCPMDANGMFPEETDDFVIMDHHTMMDDDSDAMPLPLFEDPKLPEHDVFIIHGDGDIEIVDKFSSLITKFVKRNADGQPIKICTEETFLDKTQNRFELLRLGLNSTPKQFVFLTKSEGDHWSKFKLDIAAVQMIERNTSSLAVIKTEADVPVPFNLGALHGYLIPKLFKGKSLQEIDVDSLSLDDLDAKSLENLSKLCNANVSYGLPYVYSETNIESEPITTEKGKLIQKHFTWFADHIDPENGLLGVLFSKEVIRFRQMDAMKKEKTSFLINEQLLKIIMRLNETKMEVFENALRETNQEHIVDYLEDAAVA